MLVLKLLDFVNKLLFSMKIHEKSYFTYPNDFPLTAGYNEQKQAEAYELAVEYYRRPPSKRVNYQKTGFPYPFLSLWEELEPKGKELKLLPLIKEGEGLCPVEIIMHKKYVPKERAIICIQVEKVLFVLIG